MKRLGYVAAPVGAGADRAENLRRVLRWLPWLVANYPDHAFLIPWLPYCQAFEETPEHRARGIEDDIVALRRCDDIFLVGGRLSPGMADELAIAKSCSQGVYDLLELGAEPPWRRS